jgi:hypothetical protein
MARFLPRALQSEGYSVELAIDGEQALPGSLFLEAGTIESRGRGMPFTYAFTYGNVSPRIADIRGHYITNFDLSLFKEYHPAGEWMKRAQATHSVGCDLSFADLRTLEGHRLLPRVVDDRATGETAYQVCIESIKFCLRTLFLRLSLDSPA